MRPGTHPGGNAEGRRAARGEMEDVQHQHVHSKDLQRSPETFNATFCRCMLLALASAIGIEMRQHYAFLKTWHQASCHKVSLRFDVVIMRSAFCVATSYYWRRVCPRFTSAYRKEKVPETHDPGSGVLEPAAMFGFF